MPARAETEIPSFFFLSFFLYFILFFVGGAGEHMQSISKEQLLGHTGCSFPALPCKAQKDEVPFMAQYTTVGLGYTGTLPLQTGIGFRSAPHITEVKGNFPFALQQNHTIFCKRCHGGVGGS